MSRCHDRPDRIELPGTGMLASHGGRGSGASGPSSERRRGLDLQPEDFASRDSKQGPSDLASRLEAWAGGVVERLQAFGLDGLDAGACVGDGDSHRVLFANAGPTNGETTCLLLGVDSTGVRAGLEVPASQARRARLRFTDPARALELATALQALPEQFMLSASSDREPTQAQHATADDLRGVLDEVARTSSIDTGGADLASHASMWIGWTLPRDLALEHAALLDEQLEDALVALAQVFALLVEESGASREEGLAIQARRSAGRSAKGDGSAGRSAKGDGSAGRSAKGDGSAGRSAKEDGSAGRSAKGDGSAGRSAKGAGSVDEERERAPGARKEHGLRERPDHARTRGRERDREPDDPEPPEPASDAPAHRGRAVSLKLPPRPGLRGRASKGSHAAIERGTRVRVLRGAFSGKVGVVHELDGEGSARVMLGLLAVRLEVKNLLPCVEGRPVLSTSHRKPIPDRS